jgi:cytochrome b subunit of formate dehydrogenase
VFLVYATFGFRTYLRREVLVREMGLDRDDILWLKRRMPGILGSHVSRYHLRASTTPDRSCSPTSSISCCPSSMLTGLIMTFHWPGTIVVGWAAALHLAAVGAVVCGLMVHVYMGAIFPEEKPAFFSMITGSVDELYAYGHHHKWWSEMRRPHSGTFEQTRPAESRLQTDAEGERQQ